MQRSLEQRIAKLEDSPALTWEAFFESLTDEELLSIADAAEIDGVKMSELSDSDLDAIIRAESDSVVIEILQTYKKERQYAGNDRQ